MVHQQNLIQAIRELVYEEKIDVTERVIAVTDIQIGDKEIPVMEIINI
jgi:hypothetical protein